MTHYWNCVWSNSRYADSQTRRLRAEGKLRILMQMGLTFSRSDQVLDIGCGDGAFARLVAEESGATVIGIDASANAILRARVNNNHPKVTYLRSTECKNLPIMASRPEFKSGFDKITILGVIEHLPNASEMLNQASAALKPNGLLAIVTSHRWSLFTMERLARQAIHAWPYGYQREDTQKSLLNLLREHYQITVPLRIVSSGTQCPDRLITRMDQRLSNLAPGIGRYIFAIAQNRLG